MATLKYEIEPLDLEIKTGDTFVVECVYTEKGVIGQNKDTGVDIIGDAPVNLRNCVVTGQARLQTNNQTGFPLNIQVFDQTVTNTEGKLINLGKFQIIFTPEFTKMFGGGDRQKVYVYDVQVEDAEMNVYTFMEGTIKFSPDVTRKELSINLP